LGWTVGVGLEYGFTEALRAKVEYLYVDLNGFSCNTGCSGSPVVPGGPVSFTMHDNVIRAGLNYRLWIN
jgi:outer membrane immunogenic protein